MMMNLVAQDDLIVRAMALIDGHTDIQMRSRYNGIQDYEALCGIKHGIVCELAYYPEDLNAVNAIEMAMNDGDFATYLLELMTVVIGAKGAGPNKLWLTSVLPSSKLMVRATARMRCEALLRFHKLWTKEMEYVE